MGLFKNQVGRPSNATLRNRKIAYVGTFLGVIALIGCGGYFVYKEFNNGGINSTSKNVKVTSLTYGDADGDGEVSINDATTIQKLLDGNITLSNKAMRQADVDGDNKISENDIRIIQKYLAKTVTSLPIKTGDVNNDGIVNKKDSDLLSKYVSGNKVNITKNGLVAADTNGDGVVKGNDVAILTRHVNKVAGYEVLPKLSNDSITINVPTTTSIKYGDADGDGLISINDATTIQKLLLGTTKLSNKKMRQADVDGDGRISENDAKIIQKYLAKTVTSLPIKTGDVNNDGIVNKKDSDLLSKYVSGNKVNITKNGLVAADTNGDGVVKGNDAGILTRHVNKVAGYEIIPKLSNNSITINISK